MYNDCVLKIHLCLCALVAKAKLATKSLRHKVLTSKTFLNNVEKWNLQITIIQTNTIHGLIQKTEYHIIKANNELEHSTKKPDNSHCFLTQFLFLN